MRLTIQIWFCGGI